MANDNDNNKNENNISPLPGSIDIWLSRIAGGSAAALLIFALWVSFPYFDKQIQGRVDQCNQQVLACVSDLKDARSELREIRVDLKECRK